MRALGLGLLSLLLCACGGGGTGGGGPAPTPPVVEAPIQNGSLVDLGISGLSYVSGNLNGTTGTTGQYTYRCPSGCDSIRFALGGISIGQATAATTLTLRELQGGMESGTLSELSIRRGQFLLALDRDNDPSNGVALASELATALATASLNFSSSSFEADLGALLDQLRNDTRLAADFRSKLAIPQRDWVRAILEQAEAIARGVFVETPTATSSSASELRKYVIRIPDSSLAAYLGTSPTLAAAYVRGLKPALGGGLAVAPGTGPATFDVRAVTSRGITVAAPRYFDGVEARAASVIVTAEPNALPSIGTFSLSPGLAELKSLSSIKNAAGNPFSGRPTPLGASGNDGSRNLDESLKPRNPEFDQLGLDPAGIAIASDGSNWVCDRRGPFLLQLDAQGRSTRRIGPLGNAGALPEVSRLLPAILEARQPGLGCGGIAIRPVSEDVLLGVAAALDVAGRTKASASLIRLVSFNPRTNAVRQFALPIESNENALEILDLETLDENRILALLRFRDGGPSAPWQWQIRRIDLTNASNIHERQLTSGPNAGLALEYGTAANIEASGLRFAAQETLLSLRPLGWTLDNPRGLARLDARTLLVMAEVNGGVTSRIVGGDGNFSVAEHQVDRNGLITPRASGSTSAPVFEIVPASAEQRQLVLWSITLRNPLN
jgi:hypothetical protein